MAKNSSPKRIEYTSFTVRVIPNASKNAIEGWLDAQTLKVRLTASPTDGKANKALLRYLAGQLDVAPSALEIQRGETIRTKQLRLWGMTPDEIRSKLNLCSRAQK